VIRRCPRRRNIPRRRRKASQQKLAFSHERGKHFPVHYFDHAATHPLCDVARSAWLSAVDQFPANPSSPHRLGARADRALEDARERLAAILCCRAGELIFTSGATESNNLAVFHLARSCKGQVLVSSLEHPSVLAAARRWLPKRRKLIPATREGIIDLNWLTSRVRLRRPAAILVMAANNETGVLQPWREVLALCHQHDLLFGCDAAQWVGKLPAAGLGACDIATGCAHKFGGPPGVGFLKVPGPLAPLIVGGPQEDGRRAGTENLPGILAMMAALEAREQVMAAGAHEERLIWRDRFITRLMHEVSGTELLGDGEPRLWNTTSLLLPYRPDNRRWVVVLDRLGFAVSSGSACSSGQEKASHVLSAMGRTAVDAGRAVRFSGGWETAPADWDALLECIIQAAAASPMTCQ
jgi:cysteine desulfurase